MKIRKNFRLNLESLNYISEVQEQYQLNATAALEKIIDEHKNNHQQVVSSILTKQIAKAVSDELKNTLTRIRLGSNNADKNSEILLLMVNQLLNYSGIKTYSTQQSSQFIESKRIVEERIQAFRTKKLERKHSNSNIKASDHLSEDFLKEE